MFPSHDINTCFPVTIRVVADDRDELSWNRSDLFVEILRSDLFNKDTTAVNPDFTKMPQMFPEAMNFNVPAYPYDVQEPKVDWNNGTGTDANVPAKVYFAATLNVPFLAAHPMAVCPSSPDRFSRLMPPGYRDWETDRKSVV